MLQTLTIDNYALIAHLELRLDRGFMVLTGETGAGKSIIMGALSLILGGRADAKAVRTGATKCVVEATFDVTELGLGAFFAECDLEYDAAATIIRREIYATGKSRAFVNDVPVQLSMLKALGERLIDIHSQHQNLLLGRDTFQREVIDTMAANQYELGQYRAQYGELTALRRRIADLRAEAARAAGEADYMRYQFAQLSDAELRDGELEELEQEQELLSHAEDIKSGLLAVADALEGDGRSIVADLRALTDRARRVADLWPEAREVAERLESDYIDLEDIAREVGSRAEAVAYDPARLSYVEERLATLYGLMKKHGRDTLAGLIALRDELDERLQHLDGSDGLIAELGQQEARLAESTAKCAAALTASRRKAAADFERRLAERVAYLGMPNVRFEAQVTPLPDFTPSGADAVAFLFSANKNQPLKPAGEVASGGEISRLMLAIKALVASARTLPTVVFDEIDTGVSGQIAERMGDVMRSMSAHLQVVTITHLPQVAALADAQFRVYKEDTADDTQTHITRLEGEERVAELARMLSGASLTDEALANARVLLRR